MATSNLFLGLDVHKDAVTAAVFVGQADLLSAWTLYSQNHRKHGV